MTTSEGYVSIGEAARQPGPTVDTLRFYDREGLLGELPSDAGGRLPGTRARSPHRCRRLEPGPRHRSLHT